MAALDEEIMLSTVVLGAGPDGLLGVEPTDKADQFLVTDSGRTVVHYKVSDQKPLGSWSVKQGQIITCPAVCSFQTGEYIVVHDNKVLRIWNNEDVNLDKVFKATLSAEVYRIHSIQGTEPVVLFRKGAVRRLEALLAEPQQKIETVISDEEVIKWTKLFMVFKHPVLVFITEKHGNYFAYVQMLNSCTLSKYTLLLGEEKSIIKNFTASVDRKFIYLMSLSSDGCIYESLIPVYPSDTDKNQKVVRSLLLKTVVSGSSQKEVALTVLDQNHVAVLGPPIPASKECLCIWNIKFQTLQTSKELPQGTSGQLWYYGESLFMLHGKYLTVIPYKCEVSSLAGALGKLKHSQDPGTHPIPHFVNWETSQECELGSPNSEQSKRILRRRKSEVSLKPEVPASSQLLLAIKKDSEKHIELELRKLLAVKQTPDLCTIIGDVVAGLVARCREEPAFYPRNCLLQLVQTHVLSYSLCPGLMEIALEKADVQMLQLCLQQFPDIPESVTCTCLKVFLSIGDDDLRKIDVNMESVVDCNDGVQDEKMEEQTGIVQNGFSPEADGCHSCDSDSREKARGAVQETSACPVIAQRAALLNAVLRSAYSDIFLLPYLKDIPAQHVTVFLQYLYFLYLKCSKNASMTLPGIHPPTLSQIMDWICLLLDANFTVVVMIPEAKRLLMNLYKFVKSQISVYSELNKIEVSFRELQKLNQEKNNRGRYSIEVLELF
ncbi:nucleolar protein 11 isoform X1 [Ochotona curzoniae]|uniref:nucleolar protein 11 isoform X1 n=1 Tax=Ochotona curzoniae TaxID=130825 RepID=UPI001B34F492|nr:nucleolar protein 11 isoform X1 [Ochotona curzoniae]